MTVLLDWTTYATRVVAHEQAQLRQPALARQEMRRLRCQDVDYGALLYGAGGGIVGHLNVFQEGSGSDGSNDGSSPAIQTVTSTNDDLIDNFVVALGGSVKGLKIANGSGYYYVESRDRVGFDANVPAGVTLHTGTTSSSDSSYQIDLAPDTTSWDSTLDVGQTVRDATLGVTISTVSTGLTGALIRVTFGSTSCTAAAPAVSITLSSQSGAAGSTLSYTITVTNKSGAGCPASTFSLSAAAPSGWSGDAQLSRTVARSWH